MFDLVEESPPAGTGACLCCCVVGIYAHRHIDTHTHTPTTSYADSLEPFARRVSRVCVRQKASQGENCFSRRPAQTPRNAARAKKRPVGRSVVCIIALKLPPGRPSCVKRYASFLERVLCVCALVCVYFIAYASTHLRASAVAVQRRPGVWIAFFFCLFAASFAHPSIQCPSTSALAKLRSMLTYGAFGLFTADQVL